MNMDKEQIIIRQAFEVRRLQRQYFSTRSKETLVKSRAEETKLDEMLFDYYHPHNDIFNSEN